MHRVHPTELMNLTSRMRLSILIANWWVFEPKGKETKFGTITKIDTEIVVRSMMVNRDTKMTTRRRYISIFHRAVMIPN